MYNYIVGGLINRGECSAFSPIPTNLTSGQAESMERICTVKDCESDYFALGYCRKHYKRFKKHGDPLHMTRKEPEDHGMYNTPEYKVYATMKQRCYDKNNHKYHRYGGRGIIVCDRWLNSFRDFYNDMGKRPTSKHQIDRINNDGNYEPSNCEWVTNARNNQHKITTKLTMMDAVNIREAYKDGVSRKELRDSYNVTIQNIHRIIHNQTWKVEV